MVRRMTMRHSSRLCAAWDPSGGACLPTRDPNCGSRPEPNVWSAVEYAAHSRDITALHCFGVEQALTGDEPIYPSIAGDELIEAAATDYLDDDPDAIADAIDTEACHLAQMAAAAPTEGWELGITIGTERSTVRQAPRAHAPRLAASR